MRRQVPRALVPSYIKISNDPDLVLPYPPRKGANREPDGRPRNGVYLQSFRATQTKSYIRNGTVLRRYRYPKFIPAFHSALVNNYNQHLSGDWYWQYREDGTRRDKGQHNNEIILERLENGLKPLGGLRFFEDEKKRIGIFLDRLLKSRLAFSFRKERGELLFFVCQKGRIGDLFDLDGLLADYLAMESAAGRKVLGPFKKIKNFLSSLQEDCLERYLAFDHQKVSGILETILVGLILGYPPENTYALLLEHDRDGA